MKNLKIILTAFLAILFTMGACNKKDDPINEPGWTKNSVEQNKADVEENCVEIVNQLEGLTSLKAADVTSNLNSMMSNSNPFPASIQSTKVNQILLMVSSFGKGNKNLTTIKNVLKSNPPDDSFVAEWEADKGIYTWNFDTQDWDFESSSDKIEINFPSTETGTTNNAQLTISGFTYTTITDGVVEDITDYPTGLNMVIKVDGTTVMSFTFTASYDSEGIPTQLSSELVLETYSMSFVFSNNRSTVSQTFTIKHNTSILIELGSSANGDFSTENINTNLNGDVVFPEKVITSAESHLQLMDVNLLANCNTSKLFPAIKTIDEDLTLTEDQANAKYVDALNANFNIYLQFVSTNEKIADAEFYMEEDINIRFVFADQSKTDIATYFQSGFGNLEAEINSLIATLNGKYDLEIDPIDFGK